MATQSVSSESGGAALAARLAVVDTSTLDDHALLEHLADTERLASWAASLQLAAAADFARRPLRIQRPDDDPVAVRAGWARPGRRVRDFADDEVAARLRISRQDASHRIELGCALVGLPATRASLAAGRIDVRRAKVMAGETRCLDVHTAFEVDAALIGDAERLPAARLKPNVRVAVMRADPVAAQRRAVVATGDRKVMVLPADDGMADLWAHLPAAAAMSIQAVLTAGARASKAQAVPGDDRTTDQRRADLFVEPFLAALDAGALGDQRLARRRGAPVELQVTVAASTLLRLDDAPGMLRGYGPLTADTVRDLGVGANLRRLLTDPVSGTVLDVGTTVYRPPVALLRHVQVRDQLCTFPGCGAPAETSEFDHTVPFPEGTTSAANGGMKCKRHHLLKGSGVVGVERLADGTTVWTMPTGHLHEVPLPCLDLTLDPTGRIGWSPPPKPSLRHEGRPPGPDNGRAFDTDTDTGADADADTGSTGIAEPESIDSADDRPPF